MGCMQGRRDAAEWSTVTVPWVPLHFTHGYSETATLWLGIQLRLLMEDIV